MEGRTIQYFDSLHLGYGDKYLPIVLHYLEDKWTQVYQHDSDMRDKFHLPHWNIINDIQDIPHQGETMNCGVFLCLFAHVIASGRSISDLDSEVFNHRGRLHVMNSIMTQSL